jgi:hypothetical protein
MKSDIGQQHRDACLLLIRVKLKENYHFLVLKMGYKVEVLWFKSDHLRLNFECIKRAGKRKQSYRIICGGRFIVGFWDSRG